MFPLFFSVIYVSFLFSKNSNIELSNPKPDIKIKDILSLNEKYLKIAFITDTGTIKDKSFNQSGWEGLEEFKNEFNQDKEQGITIEIKSFSPKSATEIELISNYNLAVFWGAKIIILSGYIHEVALPNIKNIYGNKIIFIIIDSSYRTQWDKNNDNDNKYWNLFNLRWQSEISGFLASVAAIFFYNDKNKDNLYSDRSEIINYSTFGGFDMPPVTTFMYGFWKGFYLYEKTKDRLNSKLSTDCEKRTNEDRFVCFMKKIEKKLKNITFKKSFKFKKLGDSFVGSFESGTKQVKGMRTAVKQKQINLIFPVAGPVTEDFLDSKDLDVIGVDTDMTQRYEGEQKTRIITSAVKQITKDTKSALKSILSFIEKSLDDDDVMKLNDSQPGSILGTGKDNFKDNFETIKKKTNDDGIITFVKDFGDIDSYFKEKGGWSKFFDDPENNFKLVLKNKE